MHQLTRCKRIQGSPKPWIADFRYWIFCHWKWIPDSARKNFLISEFHKQKFPGLRNSDSLSWGEATMKLLPAPVSSKPGVTPESSFFQVPSHRMIKQNYLLLLFLSLEPVRSRRGIAELFIEGRQLSRRETLLK